MNSCSLPFIDNRNTSICHTFVCDPMAVRLLQQILVICYSDRRSTYGYHVSYCNDPIGVLSKAYLRIIYYICSNTTYGSINVIILLSSFENKTSGVWTPFN
eukprot:493607_1